MVADDPTEKIKLKTFHCEILNDHNALHADQTSFTDLPILTHVDYQMVIANYWGVKIDIENLIETEIDILLNTPHVTQG
jgi:hypothetical protein